MDTSYLVLWKLLTIAPDRMHSAWVSVRAPTEREAIEKLLHHRPDWVVEQVTREMSP